MRVLNLSSKYQTINRSVLSTTFTKENKLVVSHRYGRYVCMYKYMEIGGKHLHGCMDESLFIILNK